MARPYGPVSFSGPFGISSSVWRGLYVKKCVCACLVLSFHLPQALSLPGCRKLYLNFVCSLSVRDWLVGRETMDECLKRRLEVRVCAERCGAYIKPPTSRLSNQKKITKHFESSKVSV
ncbi:hypothetical protein EDB81DRAFT_413728 [Dactylonectria macrodidyma]|uniref:Uncharacterized protein n=1 Tax=Dactylonectria macrodidyma TaxID=307937 RepID=A0A9P9FAS2_9HYPO|nr:hypothetical protein EDB81DRAFT_413728 [Dactylonectria macrodidyma]